MAIPAFAAGPVAVDLASAGNFAILAKSGVSTTGTTVVVGDIGVSPVGATAITGFGLSLPAASAYATSPIVIGKVYAPNYASPTPAMITTAIGDMQTAYTSGAGRTNPTATELGAGNIGGMTLAPGLYTWSTGVTIPSDVTLSGSANDIWIFQISQTLTVSSGAKVILSGGAQAKNIFWIVAGQTTIGTTAVVNGTILDQTAIVLNTGAQLNGRALAQTAVTLDSNSVTVPSESVVIYAPIQTPVLPTSPAQIYNPSNNNSNISSTISTISGNSNVTVGQQVKEIAITLRKGDTNADVMKLQQFLIAQNNGSAASALARAGATAYFGTLTRAALAEFQRAVGISPALGNFGSITRAYLSAHY